MGDMAIELANTLNITLEEALKFLPIIKKEFLLVKTIDAFLIPLSILTLVGICFMSVAGICYGIDCKDGFFSAEEIKRIGRNYKRLAIITILLFLVSIGFYLLKLHMASDFMFLKEFLPK